MEKIKDKKTYTFDDIHDIEKHILEIHSRDISKVLSDDLLLGTLDDKEKKYVSEQIVLAHEASFLIQEQQYREYAVSRLLLKGVMVVILNRNIKPNPILDLVLRKHEELLEPDKPDIDQKLMEKLESDKRGKK